MPREAVTEGAGLANLGRIHGDTAPFYYVIPKNLQNYIDCAIIGVCKVLVESLFKVLPPSAETARESAK
jgi:hypothetical protein